MSSRTQPPIIKQIIPTLVPRVNADGNEIAGVASVLHQAPLGTYLGWNIQASGFLKDQICGFSGGYVPFATTRAERVEAGDPRLSLEERYGTQEGYVCTARRAAEGLVRDRFLLRADADRVIAEAAEQPRAPLQRRERRRAARDRGSALSMTEIGKCATPRPDTVLVARLPPGPRNMLTWLGVASIVVLLALILFRITSVLVALTLVPIAAALAGGFAGQIGTFAMDGIRGVAPTAALLAFAVVYFGVMNDAGLFDPIVTRVVRFVGQDPLKIVLGTAAIASVVHLDGVGASTFMVTVPAMLPIYKRLRMDPLALTCTTALAAGTMNILPWGGPTSRAAATLQVGVTELFTPLAAATAAGMVGVFLFAALIGHRERRRLMGERRGSGRQRGADHEPTHADR